MQDTRNVQPLLLCSQMPQSMKLISIEKNSIDFACISCCVQSQLPLYQFWWWIVEIKNLNTIPYFHCHHFKNWKKTVSLQYKLLKVMFLLSQNLGSVVSGLFSSMGCWPLKLDGLHNDYITGRILLVFMYQNFTNVSSVVLIYIIIMGVVNKEILYIPHAGTSSLYIHDPLLARIGFWFLWKSNFPKFCWY